MESSIFNDEEVHALVVLPPDGGWGIMVVICSFICNFVIDGNIYSFGVFLQPLNAEFKTKMAETALIGAVMNGVCYMVGPFVSACLNRYDSRMISMFGCAIAAGGYAVSSYSVNYAMLLVGQGVLIGIGYGMLYVPTLVTPSLYFAKWRTIAVAISTCGTGVGTLVIPNVVTIALHELGWRKTYLILIGIVVIAFLASLSFRPLTPKQVASRKPVQYAGGSSKMNFQNDNRQSCTCCHWGNNYFPTTNDVISPGDAYIEDADDRYRRPSTYSRYSRISRANSMAADRGRLLSRVSFVFERFNYCWYNCLSCLCFGCCQTAVRPMYRDDIFFGHSVHLAGKSKRALKMRMKMKRDEAARKREEARRRYYMRHPAEHPTTSKEVEKDKAPAAPDDDDFTDLTHYHMTVTHVTTERELYDTYQPCCSCHIAGIRTLTTMLDLRIMKSLAFLILSINGFLFTLGYMIPFMFVHERAIEYGIPKKEAIAYISMIGGANTLGRICSGILPILVNVNCVWLTITCGLIQGAITACSGFYMKSWFQILFVTSYGFLAGPFHALRTIIVVELFGLHNLTNIFGLQLVSSGVAAMIGPTLAGLLRDFTQTYTYSFYLSGACLAGSAVMMMFIKPVRNWEVRTSFVNF